MNTPGRRTTISGWAAAAMAATGIGVVHALVVATRYHVGSFDDDAGYALVAQALASGAGLTTRLSTGSPLAGVFPPGYPALLAPLAAIWPDALLPFRVLSLALFVAIFALTWVYLGRRSVAGPVRLAVLMFLALSPVLATYATMVMPEVPFVVVFLALLLVVERWESQPRTLTLAGVGAVASAAALLWLKEAGIGLVIGVACWLALRRLWRKAAMVAAGPLLLFLPVVLARAAAGVALVGSRYSADLSGTTGGFVARVSDVVPNALWTYVSEAFGRSIIPTGFSPLPATGPIGVALAIFRWTATPLILIGFVMWVRRHRDAAAVAVPLYLIETLFYPFTNERRVILVLPVVVAWYVLGAAAVFSAVRARISSDRPAIRVSGVAFSTLIVAAAAITLAAQFPRDYLFGVGHDTSRPEGSPYMAFLRAVGGRSDVVETDYPWTTALYSGHRTGTGAFATKCDGGSISRALEIDRAGYLLTAALSGPIVDSGCVLDMAAAQPSAVRLYRTTRDSASVFELVGPGTAHPDLRDLLNQAKLASTPATASLSEIPERPQTGGDPAGRYLSAATAGGTAVLTWSWAQRQRISQLSLGAAGAQSAATTAVTIELLGPEGEWRRVAGVAGEVGTPEGRTPYLLEAFPQPVQAQAVRVTITIDAGGGDVAVHDFHALGPAD